MKVSAALCVLTVWCHCHPHSSVLRASIPVAWTLVLCLLPLGRWLLLSLESQLRPEVREVMGSDPVNVPCVRSQMPPVLPGWSSCESFSVAPLPRESGRAESLFHLGARVVAVLPL